MNCPCSKPSNVTLNLAKDLKTLKSPFARFVPSTTTLCFACTADYMNAFNKEFAVIKGIAVDHIWTELEVRRNASKF